MTTPLVVADRVSNPSAPTSTIYVQPTAPDSIILGATVSSTGTISGGLEIKANGVVQPLGYTVRASNTDLGDPVPQTTSVDSLLDGEVITGRRSGNRTLTLAVTVLVPAGTRLPAGYSSPRQLLAAGIAQVQQIVDQTQWSMVVTPTGMLPTIFDCFRGSSSVEWNHKVQQALAAVVTLTFEALPFSRSPVRQMIANVAPVLVESYDGAPDGGYQTTRVSPVTYTQAQDTSHYTQNGSSLAVMASGIPSGSTALTFPEGTYSFSAVNLGAATSLLLDVAAVVRIGSDGSGGYGSISSLQFTLTLVDSAGSSATTQSALSGAAASFNNAVNFAPISFPIPSGVNPAAITKVGLLATATLSTSATTSTVTLWVDNLRTAATSAPVSVTNGGLLGFPGLLGTARTPLQITASRSSSSPIQAILFHHAPPEARPDYTPLIPYQSSGASMGATVSMPARTDVTVTTSFNGTHSVWLGGVSFADANPRTVTVTATLNSNGGTAPTVLSGTFSSANIKHGMLQVGLMTLPARSVPAANTTASMTWSVTTGVSGDSVQDILCLDTRGQTVAVLEALSQPVVIVNEPDPLSGVGPVAVGITAASAVGCYDQTTISGGPFSGDPGNNLLLAYCPQGAPSIIIACSPRWQAERLA